MVIPRAEVPFGYRETVSQTTRHIALSAAFLMLGAVLASAAGIFPPHQFRLTDPQGLVEVRKASGDVLKVDARADLAKGDAIKLAKGGFATLRVAQIGNVYIQGGTILEVSDVEPNGRPLVRVKNGRVLLKTRSTGAERPLVVLFGPNRVELTDGMLELRYLGAKKMAAMAPLRGSAKVFDRRDKSFNLPPALILMLDSGKKKKKSLDKAKIRKSWTPFGKEVLDPDHFPTMTDEVAPTVTIVEPRNAVTLPTSDAAIRGRVDDPGIEKVKVSVDSQFRTYATVNAGQFVAEIELRRPEQVILIEAEDRAGNSGAESVKLRCSDPAPEPVAPKEEEKGFVARVKRAIKNPEKDKELVIGLAVGGFLAFLILFFLLRFLVKRLRKGAESAAGLATGVIFNRCESCGERQYEYHLFYTTEPVTSPFMRNLINNVNPMATSIMNESLENLLNTGLQGSASAKGSEQKIRVTCTWCDQCKVGNLKLEHMKGSEVFRTDDYQIIHPIFIEWVRKVYD